MRILEERPAVSFPAQTSSTAPAPAEARGVARDAIRLLVGTAHGIAHARFRDLPKFLDAGDLVVFNDSATVPGELDAERVGHGPVVLHLAAPLDDGSWVVEVRSAPDARQTVLDARPGELFTSGPATLELIAPHPRAGSSPTGDGNRLWRTAVTGPLFAHLAEAGRPIAYGYLPRRYPLSAYQTVFGVRPGSAEMASAGRGFTAELITDLVTRGVALAPVTLHTGLSSQEASEAPQAERFSVPPTTARMVNAVRDGGGRVVAVGTTATRALESAVDRGGRAVASAGWTERVVTPANPPRLVSGLVTGWHDPLASHLLLVEAVAGSDLTQRAYDEAVAADYLWHEFGDAALLLP